jgi:hypothetical protein
MNASNDRRQYKEGGPNITQRIRKWDIPPQVVTSVDPSECVADCKKAESWERHKHVASIVVFLAAEHDPGDGT